MQSPVNIAVHKIHLFHCLDCSIIDNIAMITLCFSQNESETSFIRMTSKVKEQFIYQGGKTEQPAN